MSNFFKRIGLQFFAEPESNPEQQPNNGIEPKPNTEPSSQSQSQPKTFTQEELNKIASRENEQGRAAVLRELGINPDDKGAIERYKKLIEQNQSNEERLNTQLQTEQTEKANALARAETAEIKLAAIQAGVNPEMVDDLVILAKTKVTETKTIDKVIEEMKTTHPMFYINEPQSQGTGGTHNPPRGRGGQTQSIAERLAQKQQQTVKSSFFKNT